MIFEEEFNLFTTCNVREALNSELATQNKAHPQVHPPALRGVTMLSCCNYKGYD